MSQNYIPQKIQTKPYITVSAKGLSNGLSNTFNDGADFGPDTLLNATAPNQYGPPFSNTNGIQEAINYVQAKGGGDIVVEHGTYAVNTNIVITGSNIRLRGVGRPTLNMNYNGIVGSTSPQENITIENFEIENGGITFTTSSQYATYPLPNKHLKIKNVRIVNNISGINPASVDTVFNWWYDVLLEDFYLYYNGTPSTGMDGMGLGANIRFVWNRGYLYAPNIGGAGINWMGSYYSTSTPPAQIDMTGYDVAPFGSTGATNVNYDFINVGIVGDETALSVYPEAWSVRFRGCEFYTTFNSGSLFGLIAIQEANNLNNFDITIEDSVLKTNPNNGASGRIIFVGFSSDAYLTLKNVEFQNFYNGMSTVIGLSNGSFYHILVDGLKIIDFSTTAGGVQIFSALGSAPSYDALFNNVEYLSVNGAGGAQLFLPTRSGEYEKIIARNISVRSAVPLISGASWAPIFFSGNTLDTEGSLVDVEINGRRFTIPLDNFVYPGTTPISSTEQIPHFYVTPSTPSVPASGTAQKNTNAYTVEVYLSGGSATQVQVTRGTTTYTVWSSSTATAIPPLTIRLNPGDSIILTYTTAPTWTWVAA